MSGSKVVRLALLVALVTGIWLAVCGPADIPVPQGGPGFPSIPDAGGGTREFARSTLPEPTGPDPARTESPNQPPGPPKVEELPGWVESLGLNVGRLQSPEDIVLADSYLRSLESAAFRDLETWAKSHNSDRDPESLFAEAQLIQEVELWESVRSAFRSGSYGLTKKPPRTFPDRSDYIYQQLPAQCNGESVTIMFVLPRSRFPAVFDAKEYVRNQRLFLCREAARRYNSLPDEERRRLLERYKDAIGREGLQGLPADLRRAFPIENRIDESRLIMYAPD